MRSLAADERYDTSDDTVRLPSLPSSFAPESLAGEASTGRENLAPQAADRRIAVLGPTLRFKGDIDAQEDFILLGRVEGSIHQAQRIVIAGGGVVMGTIHARVIVVHGNVEGDLHGAESVTVQKTGRVGGNIFAPRVILIEGAVFNGRIDMSGDCVVDRDENRQAGVDQAAHGARIESPMMNRILQLAAESPTQKVILVPPASREGRAVAS